MAAIWIGALATAAGVVLTILGYCGRWVWRIMMRTSRFMDDYFGEPARPGVPERPGVMARLQNVEQITTATLANGMPNDGTSLWDVVSAVRVDLAAHRVAAQKTTTDLAALRARVEQFESQREIREHTERIETITTGPPRPELEKP